MRVAHLASFLVSTSASAVCVAEDFEDPHGWITWGTGRTEWVRTDSGTPSSRTGPSGAESASFYYYIETSGGYGGDVAYLMSPYTYESAARLTFYYHMYGSGTGDLEAVLFLCPNQNEWCC